MKIITILYYAILILIIIGCGTVKNKSSNRKVICELKNYQSCMNSCEEGNANACFIAGVGFQNQLATQREYKKSVIAYSRGCELGSFESCGNLGLLNENGWGTERNLKQAMKNYTLACQAEIPVHCRNVGRLYEGNTGFVINLERSRKAYAKAIKMALIQCEAGVSESCAVAAHMYKDGIGVKKNKTKAFKLFHHSCDLGYSWACNIQP